MDRINRLKRARMKRVSNDKLFTVLEDYLKKTIKKDLECIYKKRVYLVGSNEPWVFKLHKSTNSVPGSE